MESSGITGADGALTLYEDEGDSYRYEKGEYTTINFHWEERTKKLAISRRHGSFSKMLPKRTFVVVLVNSEKNPVSSRKVEYTGLPITLTF